MYIREGHENRPASNSLIFCAAIFLSCRPFDNHAVVQEKAMSPSQHRLLENLQEVPAIRFLGSAWSMPDYCDWSTTSSTSPTFGYIDCSTTSSTSSFSSMFTMFGYIDCSTTSSMYSSSSTSTTFGYINCSTTLTICQFYFYPLVR
jgi:hypothetical protein